MNNKMGSKSKLKKGSKADPKLKDDVVTGPLFVVEVVEVLDCHHEEGFYTMKQLISYAEGTSTLIAVCKKGCGFTKPATN